MNAQKTKSAPSGQPQPTTTPTLQTPESKGITFEVLSVDPATVEISINGKQRFFVTDGEK